ncbi:phosphoglycerate mutase-like protein [Dichomitus squalens LYAD-421 SS1]|uniref:phosphoglycerate mutase-like protein n=1 Tax=Dichomitus squalens (strain LYAD-421) TaxID=732165 RepID=UPI0004412A39|nr:phosphoglycerate mutase-like protein [Dichomitus squalens LYAD-421 SS1]EJF63136.1 phosphoglycerate mutase-like protein [Dichomitus squalens LYAD-421 SS1]
MSPATQKRIYLTRHAEAEHNVTEDWTIHDAPLTSNGRQQAAALNQSTKDAIQASADLLVTSALRRTLSTTLIGYPILRKRLEAEGKPVIVLPQLQEVNNLPCDTGSAREALEADPEFAGLDFSTLTPDWTSKAGFYAATEQAIAARARWVRRWLRSRPEQRIVVVAHGDLLRYIIKGYNTHEAWANCEVREYTFAVDEADDKDGEAWLVPVKKLVAVEGDPEPTSSEQASL